MLQYSPKKSYPLELNLSVLGISWMLTEEMVVGLIPTSSMAFNGRLRRLCVPNNYKTYPDKSLNKITSEDKELIDFIDKLNVE
jgi:hypothetical protein